MGWHEVWKQLANWAPLPSFFLPPLMKALFTYCLTGLLAFAGALRSQAATPSVVVNFSVEQGQAFNLLLDGQTVPHPTTQRVHLDDVAPGAHQVEISLLTTQRSRGPRVQATVWLEEGLETSFVLTQRPGYGWQLRQVGTTALPGYGYADQPGTYGQPIDPNDDGSATDPGYGGQPGNTSAGSAGYPPTAGTTGTYPTYPSAGGAPGYPSAGSYPPAGGYPAPGNYPPTGNYPAPGSYPSPGGYATPGTYLQPLSRQDAADLVRTLRQYSFDDKRLPLFYQAVGRTYVRADDLAAMVRTMTFSESQQKAAEFGYAHLVDPQNFHRVLTALTFPTDASRVLDHLGLPRQ